MLVGIDEYTCPCCKTALHRIGEDVGARLDIVPAQLRVLVVRRPKYGCRSCEDIVLQAPAPARLIEGGLLTEATVAQVLVSKYADHLLRYRQTQIYARQGIGLDRSTIADWVGRAAWLLRPVHERLLRCSRRQHIFADETTAPVLDPGRGRTKIGQLWAYAGMIDPGAAPTRPASPTFTPPTAKPNDPSRTSPASTDAAGRRLWRLSGRSPSAMPCSLPFAGPMSAASLMKLAAAGPAPIASETLERIAGPLCPSRRKSVAAAPKERRAVRHDRSRPIIDDLEPWLRAKLALISQKTKLAKAIRYALSRWNGLTHFLDDGRIEIDSNVVERCNQAHRAQS